MSLKIGLVTGEYPPMEGGVGAFTRELAQSLASDGHAIHVITDRRARPEGSGRRWQELAEPIDAGYAMVHPRIRRWRWPSLAIIADIIRRYELNLVDIQYQAAAYDMRLPAINLLPWRLKGMVTTVVTFHDLRVPYLFPKAGAARDAALRFMARHSHGVIATNPADFDALVGELEPTRLAQIPIGSNIRPYQPDPSAIRSARQRLGLAPDTCVLAYFGFLSQSKGGEILLRALAALESDTHLLFIGGRTGSSDGGGNLAYHQQLERLISDLDLSNRVHWTGFIPQEQVSAYLLMADLAVMPYLDGVSLRRGSLMAVLAHGRPLITTIPETPVPELVHDGNVHLVPAGDVEALVQAIRNLTGDPETRARLGKAAAELAAEFSWHKIASQSVSFFNKLVQMGKPGRRP